VPANETDLSFEQPRSVFGAWLGVVLLFAIFGLFVWAVMGMMPRGDNYEQKRATARFEKLKTVRDEANKALHGYAWVDKAKGTVRVPIERAMELTVADLSQKKPAPANPIAPEVQPGLQQTAPTTAPSAPTATPTPSATAPKATTLKGKDSENLGQNAAESNPPNAAPGTQPGPAATPAASPPPGAVPPQPSAGNPTSTPVQSPAGTPLPVPGNP
jgi:hypothetical protein